MDGKVGIAMRRFSSYGPIDIRTEYYVPRAELIEQALLQVLGENPELSGHYITVWSPRQRGKTWIMQNVLWRLREPKYEQFDVLKINVEHLKQTDNVDRVVHFNISRNNQNVGS